MVTAASPTKLSLQEIETLYPGEYVLLEVTELEGGEPSRGIVIDHALEKEPLWSRMDRDQEKLTCPYLFFNGPIAPEDTTIVL